MELESRTTVENLIQETIDVLSKPSNFEEILSAVQKVGNLLPKQKQIKCTSVLSFSDRERMQFSKCDYVRFTEFLLEHVGSSSIAQDVRVRRLYDELLDGFFLNGFHSDSFLVLCGFIIKTSG